VARVWFGDFSADLESGELYRAGVKVKTQLLPFRVLQHLLAHPGKVVSKEEISKTIWLTALWITSTP
jgi:DNA-binding winged helix-turn-helix (wHTH) protein